MLDTVVRLVTSLTDRRRSLFAFTVCLVTSCSGEPAEVLTPPPSPPPVFPPVTVFGTVRVTFPVPGFPGIVINRTRLTLTRTFDGTVARDTLVTGSPNRDSVNVILTVVVQSPAETFWLTCAAIDAAGDTAFRGTKTEVTPGVTGPPLVVPITLVYTGIGADAAAVTILSSPTGTRTGDTLMLNAVALDSAGQAIPGTPIAWWSVEPAQAFLPDATTGLVIAGLPGTARIVAELVTGQADTVVLAVEAAFAAQLPTIPNHVDDRLVRP